MSRFVTTFAGSSGISGSTNGTGNRARFSFPLQATRDSGGNIYVTDSSNHTIRKITSAGTVSLFAGMPEESGTLDGAGIEARFNAPNGITVDASDNLYVCDTANHTIRKITPTGVVSTFAGLSGQPGASNGIGTAARFNWPTGIIRGGSYLYVTDRANHTIRRITISSKLVSTFVGLSGAPGSRNGLTTQARFNNPYGIAVSPSLTTFYITDSSNHTIRKMTTAGRVTSFVGLSGEPGFENGNSRVAKFNNPTGITVDEYNNIYVADTGNHIIRDISSLGVVSTFAGLAGINGGADGPITQATFSSPFGIFADPTGNKYVMDSSNHTIRLIVTPAESIPLMVVQTLLSRPRRVYDLKIDYIKSETPSTYNNTNDGEVHLTLYYDGNQSSTEPVRITLGGTAIDTRVGSTARFTRIDQQSTPHAIAINFTEFSATMSVNISSRLVTYNGIQYAQGALINIVNLT